MTTTDRPFTMCEAFQRSALMVFDADSVGPYAAQRGLPTMKLKRKPIAAKYADEIEALYSPEPHPEVHEPSGATSAQPA